MRSQTRLRECVCCGRLTRFERDVRGPRGGIHGAEACCPACGETGAKAKEEAA